MQNYRMSVTARDRQREEYLCPRQLGLEVEIQPASGEMAEQVYRVRVRNTSKENFCGIIQIEVEFEADRPGFFMPAFLYNRNRGDVEAYLDRDKKTTNFPRLAWNATVPGASDYWMVRADRLSHPVSMAYGNGTLYGISAKPLGAEGFRGFSCRLTKNGGRIGYTLGYENAPALYVEKEKMWPRESKTITLEPGACLEELITVFCRKGELAQGMNQTIRRVYGAYHQSPREVGSIRETVEAIAQAIYEDAYVDNSPNYSTRVWEKEGKIWQEPMASISWTGGVETAAPLLYAAAKLEREDIRQQALTVVDNIVEHSLNKRSGLPFDAFDGENWSTRGWWDYFLTESGHSSYLVGQALYYILLAYEIEKQYFDTQHSGWLLFVKGCLDRIEQTKDGQGAVPHLWSAEDGHGMDYDGLSGCWCVAAAAYYDQLTGERGFVESAEKSLEFYYRTHVSRMECYGTPHDTYKAVDSEGVLSFIKASRYLHELTGKKAYLTMLSDGLEYEFTFKFCWNPPIEAEPLKRLGWSACGGSVTSVCNPHIHPMSNNVMSEIRYCLEQTKDPYFASRLADTGKWAQQTYSTCDGEYDYGKKGWMSERFCYSQGLLTDGEVYEDGSKCSTWRCFLPWGAANILEGLCREWT